MIAAFYFDAIGARWTRFTMAIRIQAVRYTLFFRRSCKRWMLRSMASQPPRMESEWTRGTYGPMPSRPCLEAGCPNLSAYRGRCQRHARQRDKQINRAGRSLYSTKRWKILRRRKLFLNPLCEYVDPDEGPCMEIATDVHHKSGVENNPWDIKGLEALCHAHHSQVTRQSQLAG